MYLRKQCDYRGTSQTGKVGMSAKPPKNMKQQGSFLKDQYKLTRGKSIPNRSSLCKDRNVGEPDWHLVTVAKGLRRCAGERYERFHVLFQEV